MQKKNKQKKIPIVIICGPTAVGKSRIAVEIADKNGEIISADSMQVYKYLDIGTAKPDKELLNRTAHHLIDIINPDKDFSAYNFVEKANPIIEDISKRGKIPFVVGGTGLYLRALVYGLSEAPGKDESIRKRINKIKEQKSLSYLYQKLKKIDPEYAVKIERNDPVRIIRALEIYYLTGRSLSEYINNHQKEEQYKALWIGLKLEREDLYQKINQRTELMYQQGLINETRNLLSEGWKEDLFTKKGIGYRECVAYINKNISLEEAVEETKKNTRRYAKRQMTWFRKEKQIHWFNPSNIDQIQKVVHGWLKDYK